MKNKPKPDPDLREEIVRQLKARNYERRLELLQEIKREVSLEGTILFASVALDLPVSDGGIMAEDIEKILTQ